MDRMMNANMKNMMRMMTKQFSQFASSSRKLRTFSNQPEVNPKGLISAPSFGPSAVENVGKVNALISLRSG